MPALPRPDLAPGAHRDLVGALHDLHHEAGWPSLRTLGDAAGCSRTTVSRIFSSPRLPAWGVVELLVEEMGGDVGEFHRLWLAATSPVDGPAVRAPRIAGRRTELARVRRHLDSGDGLLLVTGEAGIGKTRLVDTAAGLASDTFVAKGACRPLSTQVPLLPVTDALRAVHQRDGGEWLRKALADCPPYVVPSLSRLLPELDQWLEFAPVPEDAWWRQRLFSAVGTALAGLAAIRPLAVLVEDLHWADSTTLDLLEHLLTQQNGPRVLGTYRLHDPTVPAATADWLARLLRLSSVATMELAPLDRDESAELLELMGEALSPEDLDRIHQRSAGVPLFTEQLAAQSRHGEALPVLLADLLDRRLGGVVGDEWSVVRALGVADRELTGAQLRGLTGVSSASLTAALHVLDQQRLITTADDDTRLRHPLLAEAVRRRLVAGEATEEHRRLAIVLADSPDHLAAEVAEHWRRAHDPEQELVWRIRTAQEAGSRFADAQAAEQWQRVLDLWPDGRERAGSPDMGKVEAFTAALDSLWHVDWQAADDLAARALRELDDSADGMAEVYRRAGMFRAHLGDPEGGLELVDRALQLFGEDGDAAGRTEALLNRVHLLEALDRNDEGVAAVALAIEISARAGELVAHRTALVFRSFDERDSGHPEQALETIREAADVELEVPDPRGDLIVACAYSFHLLNSCHGADEVAAVAQPVLEVAASWGMDDFAVDVLRGNLSEALRSAGRVHEAAALIDAVTEDAPAQHQIGTYQERGLLDLLRGRYEEATSLLDALADRYIIGVGNQIECAQDAPLADLWCGRPQRAYDRLTTTLRDVVTVKRSAANLAGLLMLAARAAADLAEAPNSEPTLRSRLLGELEQLIDRTVADPFSDPDIDAARPARCAAWEAELARLSGTPSLERWVVAASRWDDIGRPHESAYCHWRGAQVALATGQATVAKRLLRSAERDAREHVPLLGAIRATASLGSRQ